MINLGLIRVLQGELIWALGVVAADLNGRRILQKGLNTGDCEKLRLKLLNHLIGGKSAILAGLQQHEDVTRVATVDEGKHAVVVGIVLDDVLDRLDVRQLKTSRRKCPGRRSTCR